MHEWTFNTEGITWWIGCLWCGGENFCDKRVAPGLHQWLVAVVTHSLCIGQSGTRTPSVVSSSCDMQLMYKTRKNHYSGHEEAWEWSPWGQGSREMGPDKRWDEDQWQLPWLPLGNPGNGLWTGYRAAARSWWVESEASPSKQPPGEGYAASDDNRCFLIDGGGGETPGGLKEPLVSHGGFGDS